MYIYVYIWQNILFIGQRYIDAIRGNARGTYGAKEIRNGHLVRIASI